MACDWSLCFASWAGEQSEPHVRLPNMFALLGPAHTHWPDLYHACPQLCDALNRRHTPRSATLDNPPGSYVTHVVAPAGGELRLDPAALRDMGVQRVVVVDADHKGSVRMTTI